MTERMQMQDKPEKKTKQELVERALKTFVEAFLPSMAAALAAADWTDLSVAPRMLIAVLISAAATGISAVWNGVIDPLLKPETEAGKLKSKN